MRKAWEIVRKDLLLEWRQKDFLTAMLAMIVAILLTVGLTSNASAMGSSGLGPGILWIGFLIAGMIGLGRGYGREGFEDTLSGLITAPGDRAMVFWAKFGVGLLFMMVTEGLAAPLFFVAFNLHIVLSGSFALVLALGALGMASVGTLLSALALNLRGHETLMPIFVVPLQIPLLIMAVRATQLVWAGQNAEFWIHGLMAYDAIFLVLPVMTYQYLWEV